MIIGLHFFFSSRRRHTRSLCDWSSEVCSSDLKSGAQPQREMGTIKSGALPQQEMGSIKSGALPQREPGSIKSGGAAATKNGQDKKRGRCRNKNWAKKSGGAEDRKSTRLNSSHNVISYAVFCLKKNITHFCYTRN